jgi:hypothetical protein
MTALLRTMAGVSDDNAGAGERDTANGVRQAVVFGAQAFP